MTRRRRKVPADVRRAQRLGTSALLFLRRFGRVLPDSRNYMAEWVYNDGMIDDAKVVWARSIDETRDRELIDYFDDRALSRLSFENGPTLTSSPH